MNPDDTSLKNLHDIVLPPDVGWWPLAPGWYGVLLLLLVAMLWIGWRALERWKSNAYRRAALRELSTLKDATATAELLRRTALACVPRASIAGLTGRAWATWLAAQAPGAMPDAVRETLACGVYEKPATDSAQSALRDYATQWITRHEVRDTEDRIEA